MRVKLLQPRATNTGPQQINQIITVDDAEGQRMLARGQCEEVKEQQQAGGSARRQ